MINVYGYEYGFEIESILKQFSALIDKAIVLRYEKVENERRLVQTITPTYKFAILIFKKPKQTAISAKCAVVSSEKLLPIHKILSSLFFIITAPQII